MPRIALVDDDSDLRGTLAKCLELELPKEWELISEAPLDSPDEYPEWIIAHDVAVLLIDWCLNLSPRDGRRAVHYEGNEVVDVIRSVRPNFPIFVVTSFKPNENLQEHSEDIEYYVKRTELINRGHLYVQRMTRTGARYWKDHQEEIARLSDLANAVALGTASTDDVEELKALRTSLGMAFSVGADMSQAERLAEAEKFRTKVEAELQKIKDFLAKEQSK